MWTNWLPWRLIISSLARKHGFIDPMQLVSQLNRLAQPSEVAAPVELLRLAAVLHARGLINSQVIQNNLDWVWPYWVQNQFDPRNRSFVPRAFSLTHINLTHRDWTAVGLPGIEDMPVVDPRGLVTPVYDGWSIDAWLVGEDGYRLLPPRTEKAGQRLEMTDGLAVITDIADKNNRITSRAEVLSEQEHMACNITITGVMRKKGYLVVALRPFNPEGISFIHGISGIDSGWLVNGKEKVLFSDSDYRQYFSDYKGGDVARNLFQGKAPGEVKCDIGLCSAGAAFRLSPGERRRVRVDIPFGKGRKGPGGALRENWVEAVDPVPELKIPDKKMKYLYDTSVRTLILLTPGTVLAGPYTYKEFWFRDAVFALRAMLSVNLSGKAKFVIRKFFKKQTPGGYFKSQDGEWDSNGQVLWIMKKFCEFTGQLPEKSWEKPIMNAVNWMKRKRRSGKKNDKRSGLFPAGFSAEHFGPNDHYYWDDFWGIEGFNAGAFLLNALGRNDLAKACSEESRSFLDKVNRSIEIVQKEQGIYGIPASPYRRMDSSAVGCLVSSCPLKIYAPEDKWVKNTVDYLVDNDLLKGAFFHEIAHSGINIYLSLAIAQTMLRSGDDRYLAIMRSVSDLASNTGQWPEAIHPWTGGGCMGDGQHLWASSEWILMIRNCFVREEQRKLILCSGIPREWTKNKEELFFGPAATSFGKISITIRACGEKASVSIKSEWHSEPPETEIRMPGFEHVDLDPGQRTVEVVLKKNGTKKQ